LPKLKTNRGAAKRFRTTGGKKIVRQKAYHGHILTKKSPKRKRNLRQGSLVAASDTKRIRRLIPFK
jgi:large subunit ribosomal protein L35